MKMAKLIILAAFLATTLVAASAVRTTITTTVVEEEDNPGRQEQSCEEQARSQQMLSGCQRYLSQRRPSYEEVAAMVTDQEEPQLQQCCRQLRNMEERCRCEGLSLMMREQRQPGGEREEFREMRQAAESLPNKCNIGPRRCQIQSALF